MKKKGGKERQKERKDEPSVERKKDKYLRRQIIRK